MTWYSVQTGYAAYHANTVSVEAETPEAALEKAIEVANADLNWKSVDHCTSTFVDAYCMGRDEDPWDKNNSLPVPARFTERGEPPVVTLTGPRPPGGVEVTGARSACASRTLPPPSPRRFPIRRHPRQQAGGCRPAQTRRSSGHRGHGRQGNRPPPGLGRNR